MILAIMVDALNFRYLDYEAPFLQKISKEGLSAELIPSFGFEPDAAYIAGLNPEECDGGMHYWHDEAKSPFIWTKQWSRGLSYLPHFVQQPFRRFIQVVNFVKEKELGRKYSSRPAKIPLNHLYHFSISHNKLMFQPGFTSSPTIFDLLKKQNRKWAYFGSPLWRGDVSQIYRRIKKQDIQELDFVFIMLPDLDFVGHAHGTKFSEIQEAIKILDLYLEKFFKLFDQIYKDLTLIVFGDHGMVDVQNYIDIEKQLDSLKARRWVDYDYFLDSTFARFWFHNQRGREEIENALSQIDGGSTVADKDQISYRARYNHNKFGDTIYWADGGRVILPNFFQGSEKIKGMHGYRHEVRDNHAGMVLFNPRQKNHAAFDGPVDMIRLFPTFLRLLDLPNHYSKDIPPLII